MPYPPKDATYEERRAWLAQRRATMDALRGRPLTEHERLRNLLDAIFDDDDEDKAP